MPYKVILSSTSKDLAAYREAVLDAIDKLDGFVSIAMENFGARAATAIDFDDQKVRESDVVVGLLGLCYGSSPHDEPPWFTEREYDTAVEAGIDRLMFVTPDNFPVPGDLIEPDELRKRQHAFRARAKSDLIVESSPAAFADATALASAVTQALANWRPDRAEKVDAIVAQLIAAREEASKHEARAAELERALQEGQKEREALRAAVMALANKAEEPGAPAGIGQALAQLPEGETAGAEAVFQEIVDQEAAAGAATPEEAAVAAKHLGALAFLHDTRKAIDAYAEACRLDPDDTWSWISLGRLQQQAGQLDAAEQAYKNALAAAERSGDERDIGVTYHELGMIRQARGDLAGALDAYQRYHGAAERLAAQDPENAGRQRDLSVGHERIGDVRVAKGDLAGALDAHGESLAIFERLATQDPGNAGWQRDLSVSHEKIGDVRVAKGDLAGALDAYGASFAIFERLAAQDPGNAGWQRSLSVSHEKIGDVQLALGDFAGALDASGKRHAIAERLAAQDPGNAGWQLDLVESHTRIGNAKLAKSDVKPVLVVYWRNLVICQLLAGHGSAEARRELMASHARLAEVGEWDQALADGARRSYDVALTLARDLQAKGRMAPRDTWMVDDLEARLAAVRNAIGEG